MRAFPPREASSLSFKEILYEKKDGIARITINRPGRYNAYSTSCLEELAAALRDATFDDAVGVIVLTGAGDRAFCTGGDVKEYAETYIGAPRDYWKYMALFRAYIDAILSTGKPVIARINGVAVGGGNETVLACDLAVIAEHAYVGQVGVRVGSVACGGATQWLPITVGDKRAREMLFTNRADSGPPGARVGARQPRRAVGATGRRARGPGLARGDREGAEGCGRLLDRPRAPRRGGRPPRAGAPADVPRVRSLHEAAGRISGRTSPGRSRCGTRRTGWPSTTPTTSPSKA